MTTCVCNPETGTRCEFHARAPRPCACGGTLQRYAGKDGHRAEHFVKFIRNAAGKIAGTLRSDSDRLLATSGAFWACNRCEHAEVAR